MSLTRSPIELFWTAKNHFHCIDLIFYLSAILYFLTFIKFKLHLKGNIADCTVGTVGTTLFGTEMTKVYYLIYMFSKKTSSQS